MNYFQCRQYFRRGEMALLQICEPLRESCETEPVEMWKTKMDEITEINLRLMKKGALNILIQDRAKYH